MKQEVAGDVSVKRYFVDPLALEFIDVVSSGIHGVDGAKAQLKQDGDDLVERSVCSMRGMKRSGRHKKTAFHRNIVRHEEEVEGILAGDFHSLDKLLAEDVHKFLDEGKVIVKHEGEVVIAHGEVCPVEEGVKGGEDANARFLGCLDCFFAPST